MTRMAGLPAGTEPVDPRTRRAQNPLGPLSVASAAISEEVLIVDDRSALRPAQMVENKLSQMLQGALLPVSHLQTRGMLRNR